MNFSPCSATNCNPLGVISTVVQLLNIKEAPDPEVQDLRNTIKLEVSQLARLLDDLLDISRIARGLIRLKSRVTWQRSCAT